MVRLSDLDPSYAQHFHEMPLPSYDSTPWAVPPPLKEARVAIVSTAGIHRRSDQEFGLGATDYRLIPGDQNVADLIMSHVSVNFDRSGFQQDVNVVFPIELLHALVAKGEIGSVADWHYAFMGATDPTAMGDTGKQVGKMLREDGVTAALLVPV